MKDILEKIKSWSISTITIIAIGISAYVTCVHRIEDTEHGGNYQECKLLSHENSQYVAKAYMQGSRPFPMKNGGTHYIKVFHSEDESLELFKTLAKETIRYHSKGSFNNNYGRRSERYFICYGKERSIIICHNHRKYNDKEKYIVDMIYTDTELYDWDYLSSRITNE